MSIVFDLPQGLCTILPQSALKSAVGVSDEAGKQEQVVPLPSEGVSNEGTKQQQVVVSPSTELISEASDQG